MEKLLSPPSLVLTLQGPPVPSERVPWPGVCVCLHVCTRVCVGACARGVCTAGVAVLGPSTLTPCGTGSVALRGTAAVAETHSDHPEHATPGVPACGSGFRHRSGHPGPILGEWCRSRLLLSQCPVSAAGKPWRVAQGPRPCPHAGDQGGAPGSQLQPGPALAAVGLGGMSRQVGTLSAFQIKWKQIKKVKGLCNRETVAAWLLPETSAF